MNQCFQLFLAFCTSNTEKRVQTFASSKVRVSSRAVFTDQAKRSPRIRMSGPVMLMTDGRSASGEVSLMTPPNALAASSFCSGLPVRTPSLRTGRIQVTPCRNNNGMNRFLCSAEEQHRSSKKHEDSVKARNTRTKPPRCTKVPMCTSYLLGQTESRQVLASDICSC